MIPIQISFEKYIGVKNGDQIKELCTSVSDPPLVPLLVGTYLPEDRESLSLLYRVSVEAIEETTAAAATSGHQVAEIHMEAASLVVISSSLPTNR